MRTVESCARKLLKLTLIASLTAGCDETLATAPTAPQGACGLDGPAQAVTGPAAAPTGEILFSSRRNGVLDIYAMSADGSNLVNLTSHPAADLRPAWSPDGTRIAFERVQPGGTSDQVIHVMNADGSDPVRLVEGSQPEWSPDGGMIAFSRTREDDSFWGITTDVWVVDADGSNPRRLVNDAWSPSWSPDGTKIAFTINGLIKTVDADGSNAELLGTGTDPDWSPDGTKIAFVDDPHRNNRALDIHVMDADGTNRVKLTEHPRRDVGPAWSPDGTKIAFVSERDGDREIYVMDADGSNPVNLTSHPSCGDNDPSWGPGR